MTFSSLQSFSAFSLDYEITTDPSSIPCLLHGMLSSSTLLAIIMLCSLWGAERTSAIFRLTSSPLLTMDTENGAGAEDVEQTTTVLLDLDTGTTETDPVTDGGIEESSQTVVISTVTSALNNVADGMENNVTPKELTPTSIDPKQPISLDVFNVTNDENAFPVLDSASKETTNNVTLIPLQHLSDVYPYDDQSGSIMELPNNETEKQCFCNIPGPEGQKGDKGERGVAGDPGIPGDRGLQGLKGNTGEPGHEGTKGDKGDKGEPGVMGPVGLKGEPGDLCTMCAKGDQEVRGILGGDFPAEQKGEKGEPGDEGMDGEKGAKGSPGEKGAEGSQGKTGETGLKGSVGLHGSVGPKGDKGNQGSMGPPGFQGLPGMPGRKGEKGRPGGHTEHDNIAFSVGLQLQRNVWSPGLPVRFNKVFVNENNVYNVKSGIFVASIDGVYFFTYQLSIAQRSFSAGLIQNGNVVLQTQARQHDQHFCQSSGSMLLRLYEDDEIWIQLLSDTESLLVTEGLSDSAFTGILLYPLED
uniref:Otolin 1 n=1 Tax=Leptobrachium leishanense TaxID=445787 RepID=A0A8C5PZH1_9ANUR